MPAPYTGGCQCGAVRYEVSAEPERVAACHCGECQRQSGSAFGMSMLVREEAFRLLQGTVKLFTRSSDSGRPVAGAFCPECGTRIYHIPGYLEGIVNVKPGTLDETGWLRPESHFWTSKHQAWLPLPEDASCHETQPF